MLLCFFKRCYYDVALTIAVFVFVVVVVVVNKGFFGIITIIAVRTTIVTVAVLQLP